MPSNRDLEPGGRSLFSKMRRLRKGGHVLTIVFIILMNYCIFRLKQRKIYMTDNFFVSYCIKPTDML